MGITLGRPFLAEHTLNMDEDSRMRKEIAVRNPRTGKIDYSIQPPSRNELNATAAAMRKAQTHWGGLPLSARCDAMLALCDAVDRHRGEIIDRLTEDTGRDRKSVV